MFSKTTEHLIRWFVYPGALNFKPTKRVQTTRAQAAKMIQIQISATVTVFECSEVLNCVPNGSQGQKWSLEIIQSKHNRSWLDNITLNNKFPPKIPNFGWPPGPPTIEINGDYVNYGEPWKIQRVNRNAWWQTYSTSRMRSTGVLAWLTT